MLVITKGNPSCLTGMSHKLCLLQLRNEEGKWPGSGKKGRAKSSSSSRQEFGRLLDLSKYDEVGRLTLVKTSRTAQGGVSKFIMETDFSIYSISYEAESVINVLK